MTTTIATDDVAADAERMILEQAVTVGRLQDRVDHTEGFVGLGGNYIVQHNKAVQELVTARTRLEELKRRKKRYDAKLAEQ